MKNYDYNAEFANQDYIEENFDAKIDLVQDRNFVDNLMALWSYFQDAPRGADLAYILFALGYFVCPVDAIPDFLLFVGHTDDMTVVAAIVAILGTRLEGYLD